MTYRKLLTISRPRFWIYLLGPYLIGAIISLPPTDIITHPLFWLGFLYFTLPANLFLYGINDIHDYDTDKDNPKKTSYEELVTPQEHRFLYTWILITNLPFVTLVLFLSKTAIIAVIGFILLSWQYSAPPIRAKTIPFLDSSFNILYMLPALIGYGLISSLPVAISLLIASSLWTMAMHAYSAVPDIETDRHADLKTIATQLGTYGTLGVCLLLYIGAASLAYPWLGNVALMIGMVYGGMMIMSMIYTQHLFRLYTLFPWINIVMGKLLFWTVVWQW